MQLNPSPMTPSADSIAVCGRKTVYEDNPESYHKYKNPEPAGGGIIIFAP
jgi:hypothetical protein